MSRAISMPPGARTLCTKPITCRTKEGRFVIGPHTKFAAIDVITELPPRAGRRADRVASTPATSLVTRSQHYEPTGVLVWLPRLRLFGSWDHDHGDLYVFPRTTLAQILADPAPYLITQWEPQRGVPIWSHRGARAAFDVVPRDPEAEAEQRRRAAAERLVQAAALGDAKTLTKHLGELVDVDDDDEREQIFGGVVNAMRDHATNRRAAEGKKLLDAFIRVSVPARSATATVQGSTTGLEMNVHEALASFAVVLAILADDDSVFTRAKRLMPKRLTLAALAFNLACYHALKRQKRPLVRYVAEALRLGMTAAPFECDSDFDAYRDDPDFAALLAR